MWNRIRITNAAIPTMDDNFTASKVLYNFASSINCFGLSG